MLALFLVVLAQPGGWLQPDPEPDPPTPVVTPVVVPEPVEEIVYIPVPAVTYPGSSTVWEHGQASRRIQWENIDGDLVKVELFRGGQNLGEITSTEWVDNTGSLRLDTDVSSSWGSGRNFQIRVTSITGDQAISEVFQIKAPIDVNIPDSQTRWSTGESNVEIAWSGAPGSTVQILLRKNGHFVGPISDWIENTGTYFLDYSIPSDWGTGSGYSVVVTDNLGNSYSSPGFVIDGIWVQSPSSSSIWYKGRVPGSVSWAGGGQAVRVELYNGDELIGELTNGWSDNEHSYSFSEPVPVDWEETPFYRIHVRGMGSSSETLEGWSDYFTVEMSNDLIEGAGVLEQSISGAIDFQDDVDYFKFASQGRLIHEFSVQSGSGVSIDLVSADSVTVLATFGSNGYEWTPQNSDIYFLRVHSTNGAESDYELSLSKRLPPERVRRFQIGGWYGMPLTGLKDVVPSGFGAFISYSPVNFAEVSAEWMSLETGEDIDYFNVIWGRQSFIGGYAGLRSPDFSGVRVRAGGGYFIRMNSEEMLLRSQYADFANALSDGLKWYAGVDYKLFSSHFGAALYTRLQYNALSGGDGLLNLGLGIAF